MSISRLLRFAWLAVAWVSSARADELLDDSPPIPPATAAAIAQPAPPPTSTPTPEPIAPVPAARDAAPFAPAPAPVVRAYAPSVAPAPAAVPGGPSTPDATAVRTDSALGPATAPPSAALDSGHPPATAGSATAGASTNEVDTSATSPVTDDRRLQLAAMAGVGTTFDKTPGGVNPLGFGFGLRGDFRVLDELALGARVLYFVGGASDLPTGKVDMTSWLIAGEASYVLDLDPVLVQPGMLLGVASRDVGGRPAFTNATDQSFVPGSQNHTLFGLYLAPGVGVIVPLSIIERDLAAFFLGADARLDLMFFGRLSSNVQLLVQGGLRL
jgi:hypothetical protein